jgi:hypothetical protein
LNKHEWEFVDERCKELHEAGFIQPSSSNFAAVIVMSAKKDSARLWIEKRMCTFEPSYTSGQVTHAHP